MRTIVSLAFGVVALTLASCGGGDDESQTATPTAPSTTPAATASPTASPAPANRLAYVDDGGNVWLANADATDKTQLLEAQSCPHARLLWSPAGDRLACIGVDRLAVAALDGQVLLNVEGTAGLSWSPDGTRMLYGAATLVATPSPPSPAVYDRTLYLADRDGNELDRIPGASAGIWSPDGSSFAYRSDSGEVFIYELPSSESRSLGVTVDSLYYWVLGGGAILASTNQRECGVNCLFDTNLLDPATGSLTRIPELDNATFVPFPDGSRVITLTFEPAAAGFTMAILDLKTGASVPIQGATIGYPSEGIPNHHIAVSPDSSTIYWATVLPFDGVAQRVQLFRARSDGSGLTAIATLPALLAWFSPDFQKVVYHNSGVLSAAAIDGTGPLEIGPSSLTCCSSSLWQPRSPP